MLPKAKQQIVRLLLVQTVIGVVVCLLIALCVGQSAGLSVTLGVLASLAANGYMAWRTLRASRGKWDPKAIVMGLFKGSIGKFVIIGLSVFMYARYMDQLWAYFLLGIAIVQLGFWLAPLWWQRKPCAV